MARFRHKIDQSCPSCPETRVEELCSFLFCGYGIFLLVPYSSLSPFYSPIRLDQSRLELGVMILLCGVALAFAVHSGRCIYRSFFSCVAACLWWSIAVVYILANMPPLPIWGAFGCGLWMVRSWVDLRGHLRWHQEASGGGVKMNSSPHV